MQRNFLYTPQVGQVGGAESTHIPPQTDSNKRCKNNLKHESFLHLTSQQIECDFFCHHLYF